jgi:F-type H+-transporting ATPase subunit b
MLIDWFTVAAQIANFAILVWILKRFLYRPVLDAMAAREKRVRETVAAADRQKAAAEEEANRLREQQDAFEQKKEDLLKKAREEASATRDELLAQARKEADSSQAQRRNSLDRDWQEFHAELTQRAQGEALAVARQALRELADVEIEERMVAAFLKKLTALDGDAKAQLQTAARGSARPLVVRSGFTLAAPIRERLQQALRDQFATKSEVQFETSPGLIAGVEVAFDGQKVAWTFDDFLRSLELNVRNLVEKETKAHAGRA